MTMTMYQHRTQFLSTPSARRATLMALPSLSRMAYFYPRPPRGGRHKHALVIKLLKIFLSTPSARRATVRRWMPKPKPPNFYPRPPRGGRPLALHKSRAALAISIHALREEGDWP